MAAQPEAWLRGPVEGIIDDLQPSAHAFIAAREHVVEAVAGLTPAQLWARPGGAASVGFHLMHLTGSTDRLLTYARGKMLDDRLKAAMEAEKNPSEPRPTADDLVKQWEAAVERALKQLGDAKPADLAIARSVGRAQLPSTVRGLLFHAAEHAARHVGQIVTTAKVVKGEG
jgi:uncharacterized damage-inducible protein DinB